MKELPSLQGVTPGPTTAAAAAAAAVAAAAVVAVAAGRARATTGASQTGIKDGTKAESPGIVSGSNGGNISSYKIFIIILTSCIHIYI